MSFKRRTGFSGQRLVLVTRPEIVEPTYRNEQVRNPLLVLEPGVAVLAAAPSYVAKATVSDHAAEENWVKPRERAPIKIGQRGDFPTMADVETHLKPVIRPQDTANQMSAV